MTVNLPGLQDFVATLAADGEPGLAVGVYLDGELACSATAGCAVPEHGVPVSEHTAFDIASVSKHMTSACILLLARDGLVDLDGDIHATLPELALAQPVTLRQCLTHTAGLRDYFSLCDIAGIPTLGMGEGRFLDLVAGQAELDFPPGSSFSYSNTGYALAAVLARRVTGDSLAKLAAERVFGPLGMAATHFRDDVSLLVPRLAGGYLTGPGGSGFRRLDVTEEVVGDGAVVTTLADLASWHSFMTSGSVLGSDLRDGLLARQRLTDGTEIGYALGLESVDLEGNPAWWHSGSWAGYRAAVIYLPGQRAGVSVLANRNDRYPSHVAGAVATALVTGGDPATCYAAQSGIPAPPEQARTEAPGVAGLWHEPDQDVFVEFAVDDGQVTCREHGQELRFVLGTDGSWHGIGGAAAATYTQQARHLISSWGLSARPESRFERAAPVPPQEPTAPLPVGIFRNEELRAHAEVSPDKHGAAQIVIGLAAPRLLVPAGPGVWRSTPAGGALTVRLADDGRGLLLSVPGARRVRFDPVDSPAGPGLIRGLTGAR
ncbi:MAG TPA: serine hydrolase domain-containing protein [Streptosporangiaceae bacterium]